MTPVEIMLIIGEVVAISAAFYIIKALLGKAGIELSEKQMAIVHGIVEDAILYVERHVLNLQKKDDSGSRVSGEEKLQLAVDFAEKLLDKHKLGSYKMLIVPLIESKLQAMLHDEESGMS